jgi:hypothetical protein
MLRPKLVPKPQTKVFSTIEQPQYPQMEIMIQSTTTRGSVSNTRDWNITQEGAQRMIPQDSSKLE